MNDMGGHGPDLLKGANLACVCRNGGKLRKQLSRSSGRGSNCAPTKCETPSRYPITLRSTDVNRKGNCGCIPAISKPSAGIRSNDCSVFIHFVSRFPQGNHTQFRREDRLEK